MSTPSQKAKIFDEMLQFLADPFFQIPVRTFMDEKCLIFDPGMEPAEEHKTIFNQYKRMIDALLESFCRDVGIKVEDAVAGISKMNSIPDIRMIYQLIFEQVLAADDFDVFYQVMVKRNIMIQEQVLLMIIAATGSIPDSLLPDQHKSSQRELAAAARVDIDDRAEEEILQEVMRKSKVEHEQQQARQKEEDDAMKKTVELSKQEVGFLKRERTLLEQNLQKASQEVKPDSPPSTDLSKLTLESKETTAPKGRPADAPLRAPGGSSGPAELPPVTGGKYMTSADAAMAWMQSAKTDASSDSTAASRAAMAASLSQLSPAELQERQRYLKEQRDRLLAMKKEAREKQLGKAEQSQSGRPQSARTARSALQGDVDTLSEEEQKKIAMRKAIAAKLRQEVINH